jgi:hypothetical protein
MPTLKRRPKPPKALISYQREIVCEPWYDEQGSAVTDTFEKARRVGGSEAACIRAMSWALGREMLSDERAKSMGLQPGDFIQREPMNVYVTSKDYPGARGLVAKVADNCKELAPYDPECAQAVASGTKVYFPSTNTFVEAKAPTKSAIRGETGAVVIDEFSFVKQQEDVYGAAKLVANANLGNAHGYPVLFVCTPWEEGSFAHRVFTELGDDGKSTFGFRHHSIDIYQAHAAGFPIDIEKAFAELPIEELRDTEYKCIWSRGGSIFFPPAKLRLCQEEELPYRWERAPVWYGIDVGHGVGRDFTAIVQWRLIENEYWVTGIRAFNHLELDDQFDQIVPWITEHPGEVRVDRGAGGRLFIQGLEKRLKGTHVKITGAGMNLQDQEKYAVRLKHVLDASQLRIYTGTECGGDSDGHRALMLELAKLKAKMSGGGRLVLETPRDPLQGHCDRGWASMIGLSGGAGKSINVGTTSSRHSNGGHRPAPTIINFDDIGI